MKAYFDGSGQSNSPFLVLAGVVAPDPLWESFESKWRDILSSREPQAPYIHMKELIPLKGAFTAEQGWNQTNASKLIWDCLLYAQHLDKNDYRSFTCSVDMDAYKELKERGNRLPGIYAMCSRFCPQMVLKWYLKDFPNNFPQELHFFFDQGEKQKGEFERRWIAGKKRGRGLSNHWHLIKSVKSVDTRRYPALQLADLIAWSHNRRLMFEKTGAEMPWRSLSEIAEKVLPSPEEN